VTAPPRALLHRRYQGFGDWLFALAVAKLVNRQRPDVELYAQHRLPDGMPAQAWRCSDVRWRGSRPPRPFVEVFELIYRKWPPDDYIESTVANWNDLTPWPIVYEPGILPAFCGGQRWHGHGDYIAMVGHGKTTERGEREWGYPNWAALAAGLAQHADVVQVGAARSLLLPSVRERYLGRRFPEVVRVLCGARLYIGPENGVMVLAAFLGVPTITLYDGHKVDPPFNRALRTSFENHHKIERRAEWPEVLEEVLAWSGRIGSRAA
jgi:hypothetical protein